MSVGKGLVVVGLDGEMSSADLSEGGQLIQSGLAVLADDGQMRIRSDLISWDEMAWSERAAQVHLLERADVDRAPRASEVDRTQHAWLLEQGAADGRRELITVGFNVGAFDHPFFVATLPHTMTLISRRTIDLNALCFTLDGWDPNPANTTRDWAGWKRSATKAGLARLKEMGVDGREHDAGFDAALAITTWLWLREQIRSAHRTPRPTSAHR